MITHDVHQNTPEWFAARAGIPTASAAKKLITAAKLQPTKNTEDYSIALAVEVFEKDIANGHKNVQWEGNWITERGHNLEPESRSRFTLDSGLKTIPGTFVTDDLMRSGCSPDAIIPSKGRENDEGLEIKNPLPDEFVRVAMHIDQHGIPPAEYMLQCYFSLHVTGFKKWHFMVNHPHFEPSYAVIFPKPEVMEVIKSQVTKVITRRDEIIQQFTKKVEAL